MTILVKDLFLIAFIQVIFPVDSLSTKTLTWADDACSSTFDISADQSYEVIYAGEKTEWSICNDFTFSGTLSGYEVCLSVDKLELDSCDVKLEVRDNHFRGNADKTYDCKSNPAPTDKYCIPSGNLMWTEVKASTINRSKITYRITAGKKKEDDINLTGLSIMLPVIACIGGVIILVIVVIYCKRRSQARASQGATYNTAYPTYGQGQQNVITSPQQAYSYTPVNQTFVPQTNPYQPQQTSPYQYTGMQQAPNQMTAYQPPSTGYSPYPSAPPVETGNPDCLGQPPPSYNEITAQSHQQKERNDVTIHGACKNDP